MKPHIISYGTILSPSTYMLHHENLKSMDTITGLDWLSEWNGTTKWRMVTDFLYREFGNETCDEDFCSFLFHEIYEDGMSLDSITVDEALRTIKKYIHKVGKDGIVRKYKSGQQFYNSITILDMMNHKTYIKHLPPCTTMKELVIDGLAEKYIKGWGFNPSEVTWLVSNEIIIDEKVNHLKINEA